MCIGITGALRTTSTEALLYIISIPPSDVYSQFVAANTAVRIYSVGLWKIKPYGHSNILKFSGITLPKCFDSCITEINFDKKFAVQIPERKVWKTSDPTSGFEKIIYTDGSKTTDSCGAGFVVLNSTENYGYRLPDYCSIFQCEILAIKMACLYQLNLKPKCKNIAICVDSQAVLKALDSPKTSSTLIKQCKNALNSLSNLAEITLIWIPSHCGLSGNESADCMAKWGASRHSSWAEKVAPSPSLTFIDIKLKLLANCKNNWLSTNSAYKHAWGPLSDTNTKYILRFNRETLRKIVFAITGHWPIGRHGRRLGLTIGTSCPGCGLAPQDTDSVHFWCMCPALCRLRYSLFEKYWFGDMRELEEFQLSTRIEFIILSRWF